MRDKLDQDSTWIFVGPDMDGSPPGKNDKKKSSGVFHGTAMLSLVLGNTLGVAKKVSPIIVRLPGSMLDQDGNAIRVFQPEHIIIALGKVNDQLQVREGGATAPASCVVLLAHYYPSGTVEEIWALRVWSLLEEMEKKGAILVTGQGEDNGNCAKLLHGLHGPHRELLRLTEFCTGNVKEGEGSVDGW